jgi:hypothetical protein
MAARRGRGVGQSLLLRHSDADRLLRRHEVIEMLGGVGNRELDAPDAAVERVDVRAVLRRNRGPRVFSNVAAVIGGELGSAHGF